MYDDRDRARLEFRLVICRRADRQAERHSNPTPLTCAADSRLAPRLEHDGCGLYNAALRAGNETATSLVGLL